jgi:hypothetical protein
MTTESHAIVRLRPVPKWVVYQGCHHEEQYRRSED